MLLLLITINSPAGNKNIFAKGQILELWHENTTVNLTVIWTYTVHKL